MSGLGWKLRRLRAMTAAEVIQRARASFRDRLIPPAWSRWTPAEAGVRLFETGPRPGLDSGHGSHSGAGSGPGFSSGSGGVLGYDRWSRVAVVPPAESCRGTLDAAERLARGRWTRFGREIALDDPPRWHVEPVSGARWPDRPSREIDYRRTDLPGGAKAVWEAGRLTMLPTLALAARLGGAPVHAGRARRWLADFVARNPLGHGIHHTSGIEMAIRTITMGWTLALLEGDESRAAAGLIAQQALWCRDHLSLGSSANNHLLAEYAAMVVAGAGLPSLRGADRLLDQGLAGLAHEVPLQLHDDGVTAEQAFRYLPFVWELLLPALTLAEAAGRVIPRAVRERLARSLEFARALRRADGTLPPIGDEDDARILLADETGTRLDLSGNALASWLGEPGLADHAQGLAHLLTGHSAATARTAPDGERTFASGGCTVWRAGSAFATFDHGPLGLGSLAAHGHADALSVTLRQGADDPIVDPGTLAYHENEAARDATRATPSHSTVHFGGRSQSEMLGPFLWGRRASVARDGEGWRCRWWSGEEHARSVRFSAGELAIEDRVMGSAPEIVFALAPGAEVRLDGARAEVTVGRSTMRVESEGIEAWRVEAGECAATFGMRQPSPKLTARCPGSAVSTRLRFGPR